MATSSPSWKREFLTFFGSLKLAIVLLLLIAAGSIIGTVIPQDQGVDVVRNGAFPEWLKAVMMASRAYDVYHAFWFNFLLAMMFLNLAVCTYLRFPPTWRRYKMKTPATPGAAALPEIHRLATGPTPMKLDSLRKRGWRLTPQGEDVVFAEKNKFVRLAPTFIHISLFLVMGGALWGGLSGVKHSVPLMVGEAVASEQIVEQAFQRGRWHAEPTPFDLKLDAFRMEFRPSGQVKQYYSDVTVTPRDGRPAYKRTLWVNEPLIVDGMYFYQSFWGVGGFTYRIDGKPTRTTLVQARTGGYMSKPFKLGGQEYMFYLRAFEEPGLLVSTKDFEPKAQVVPGFPSAMNGQTFEVAEYHLFSGLETKIDPGIPLVYLGCGMMVLGLCMLPFRHREVWLRRDEDGWFLGGRTHRGKVILKREMAELARLWDAEAPQPSRPEPMGASA
jgi:cytochrome c biogenesis protein